MRNWALRGMSTVSTRQPTHSSILQDSSLPDNLQVQWGSQDHYEIVRKVGRGKYSEVGFSFHTYTVCDLEPSSGLRGHKHSERRKVHYQSAKASKEEENQARNQNFAKSRWRSECRCFARCRAGSVVQDSQPHYRIR